MTALLVAHLLDAMRHGYRCWSELHPYYRDATRGAWREWLCRR